MGHTPSLAPPVTQRSFRPTSARAVVKNKLRQTQVQEVIQLRRELTIPTVEIVQVLQNKNQSKRPQKSIQDKGRQLFPAVADTKTL